MIWGNDTDRDWEQYGREDPYWGVLTDDQFRSANLTPEAKEHFFATGEAHVEALFRTIVQHVRPDFVPERTLEFGCGVGRLLIPLARRCRAVVGVDISDAMLKEAAENVSARALGNVELIKSDDALSRVSGRFDLIHSFIVFQHLARDRGERVAARLIELLSVGGVAALHFTYGSTAPAWRRALGWISKSAPLGQVLSNLVRRQRWNAPIMQMNIFPLESLVALVRERGIDEIFLQFVPLAGSESVMLIFEKRK